jgi:hypothetical protein
MVSLSEHQRFSKGLLMTDIRRADSDRAGIERGPAHRRLWLTAGWLFLGYIVLTFAGVAFEHSLLLGDSPTQATAALVDSSMAKNFTGGYIEFLATLLYLVGALLIARLLRGDGVAGDWVSSCISAAAVVGVAVTVTAGFAAGAAAIYDGHHGAPLSTVTSLNDVRNFAFFLSGGLSGLFALGVAAAAWMTGRLPRWVSYSGAVVGTLFLVAIPGARTGLINVSTLIGFAWIAALGVAALRRSRRPVAEATAGRPIPAAV